MNKANSLQRLPIYFESTEPLDFFKGVAQRNRSRRHHERKQARETSRDAVTLCKTLIALGEIT